MCVSQWLFRLCPVLDLQSQSRQRITKLLEKAGIYGLGDKINTLSDGQDLIKFAAFVADKHCSVAGSDSNASTESGIDEYEIDLDTGMDVITLDEVSYHCTMEDGWMVIYDKVYNVTEYLERGSHPGGDDVMVEYLGYDATMAFRGVGHSRGAGRVLEKYLVGILPRSERLGLTADYT